MGEGDTFTLQNKEVTAWESVSEQHGFQAQRDLGLNLFH